MEVIVLMEGTHNNKGPIEKKNIIKVIDPICSSVILLKGKSNILVDTGYYGFEEKLLNALKKQGVKPEEIDIVINTHRHFDHTANNHFFKRASKVSEMGVWFPKKRIDVYKSVDDIKIPSIKLIATPGHTKESCSVIVESNNKTYVMSGDAVDEGIIRAGKDAIQGDKEAYIKSAKTIFSIADIIIPGHGRIIEGDLLKELKGIVDKW